MRVSADSDSPWPSQEYGSRKPDRPYPSGLSPQASIKYPTRDYFIRHRILELDGPHYNVPGNSSVEGTSVYW